MRKGRKYPLTIAITFAPLNSTDADRDAINKTKGANQIVKLLLLGSCVALRNPQEIGEPDIGNVRIKDEVGIGIGAAALA